MFYNIIIVVVSTVRSIWVNVCLSVVEVEYVVGDLYSKRFSRCDEIISYLLV